MTERRPARGRPAIPGPRRRVQLSPSQDAFIARLAAKWGCGWPDALRRVLDVLQEAPQQPLHPSEQREVSNG